MEPVGVHTLWELPNRMQELGSCFPSAFRVSICKLGLSLPLTSGCSEHGVNDIDASTRTGYRVDPQQIIAIIVAISLKKGRRAKGRGGGGSAKSSSIRSRGESTEP